MPRQKRMRILQNEAIFKKLVGHGITCVWQARGSIWNSSSHQMWQVRPRAKHCQKNSWIENADDIEGFLFSLSPRGIEITIYKPRKSDPCTCVANVFGMFYNKPIIEKIKKLSICANDNNWIYCVLCRCNYAKWYHRFFSVTPYVYARCPN